MSKLQLLMLSFATAVFVAVTQFQAAPPVAAAVTPTQSSEVINFAIQQLDKPYKLGATGMDRYDCSGLVYRTFQETGLLDKIGGDRKLARGYYHWFKRHGRVTTEPQVGDLVVWARHHHRVSHIGIFDGYNRWGDPMAISALVNPYGVSRTRVFGIDIPLKAYLHVNLTR